MTRTRFMALVAAAAMVSAMATTIWAAEPRADVAKPNIIFILADDLGIDGVGCYGSDEYRKHTPHINALARTGLRFEQCYSRLSAVLRAVC